MSPLDDLAVQGESSAGDRDTIAVGDISGSAVAIGRGASVIINKAQSQADEARAQEQYEEERLARAVVDLVESLDKQARQSVPGSGNPYKDLLSYELTDANRFYGRAAAREELLERLTCADSRCRFVVLHGDAGVGKTSLLRAGIVSALLGDEHLPLIVRATASPLAEAIKQSLLTDLNATPNLKAAPLRAFMRQVAVSLGDGKQIFVLLDQFERYFAPSVDIETRQHFVEDLGACLYDIETRVRWLISIRAAWLGHLNTFQSAISRPFVNMFVLPPLSREEARDAIEKPAEAAGLAVEPALLTSMLNDLGGDAILPASLQIVCNRLVEDLARDERQLAAAAYEEAGGADGILRDYLDAVLERDFSAADREGAWRILEAVSSSKEDSAAEANLIAQLESSGIEADTTRRLLAVLESNGLLRQSGEAYQLTSDGLLPRIRQWSAERAALEQARAEAARQLRQIRRSALRGLLAGGLGFALAFLIVYAGQISNRQLLLYLTVLRAVPGAVGGLLLLFFVDVALFTYLDRRRYMRWVAGGLAGAAALAIAVVMHLSLRNPTLQELALAAIEGALWGAVLGLGTVWVMTTGRRLWLVVSIVVIASSLMLLLADSIGGALGEPSSAAVVVLAGAIISLCILGAALLARQGGRESIGT